MEEVFKPIVGFTDYYISNLGNVVSCKRKYPIVMKPKLDRYGYKCVCLRKDGKNVHFTVHRLVAITFISNKLNKPCVNHIDGNKLNNTVSNLEWVTVAENTKHAFDMGLFTVSRDDKGRWSTTHEHTVKY